MYHYLLNLLIKLCLKINGDAAVKVHILLLGLCLMVSIVLPAASFADEAAVFEESEARFEETTAAPATETTHATSETKEKNSQASFGFTLPTGTVISHVEDYAAPVFSPNRQPRTLEASQHARMFALLMIFAIIPLVTGQGGQVFRKLARPFGRIPVKRFAFSELSRKLPFLAVAVALVFLSTGNASAITYSSVKDAVTSALGKGGKVFQTDIAITPDAERLLKKNAGWTPGKKSYKVYYSKSEDGKPRRYAFVLEDKLAICGGLHKYCVAVNADGTVADVSILELTCDRSYCINTRSFLGQFRQFDVRNVDKKAKTYDAMSGATLSTDLTRDIVKRALGLMALVNGNGHV